MSSNSVDIILNGKETVTGASNQAIGGLSKLNDALNGTQNKLRGFNSIMELAFGFHIGRFFFEKVRAGIVGIAEGFSEAQKAGLGFTESMMDAARAAIGVTTAVQRLSENMKLVRQGETAFGKGVNAETNKAAAQAYKEAFDAFSEAYQKANNDRGASASVGENILRGLLGAWQPEGARQDARNRELMANDDKRKLAAAYEAYERTRKAEDLTDALSPYYPLVSRFPVWDHLTAATFLPTLETRLGQGAGYLGSGIGRLEHIFGSPFSALPEAFMKAVGAKDAQSLKREDLLEQLNIERLRLQEAQSSLFRRDAEAHSVGAQDARFLTRGSGSLYSPEVAAIERSNAHLEEIKKKIADLETKLNNLAVIGTADKL